MIITGDALRFVDKHPSKELIHLTLAVKTVIACRVSPKQKQEVVELVRRTVKTYSLNNSLEKMYKLVNW
jgi:phospholipid-transporting ATPase